MLVAISDTPETTRTVTESLRCRCSHPGLVAVPRGASEQPYCLTDGPVSPDTQQVCSIMSPRVCPTTPAPVLLLGPNAVDPNPGGSDTSLSTRMHFPKTIPKSIGRTLRARSRNTSCQWEQWDVSTSHQSR